jgi:gliotoxin/aspirochlorine biosynthesis aminotransferase
VTQGNHPLAVGLALASNTQMSSLTAIATTALLQSPQLDSLIALNSSRLAEGYDVITSFFRQHNIEYMPVSAGPFIFAKLVPGATTWEEEAEKLGACKAAGVVISSGKGYHVVDSEKGWGRLTYAIPMDELKEALRRVEIGLGLISRDVNGTSNSP